MVIRKNTDSVNIDAINEAFEKQRKELDESLKYASYIQNALLPDELSIQKNFNQHFLIYLPCAIVSGDYFWMNHKNNRLMFAIADCTGHGVPGAFLSIMGLAVMNQIVERNPHISAAMFLNTLREHMMKALHQTGQTSEQKDGIDMSMVIIDADNNSMQFAGAFLPVYIVKADSQLIEIQGDKMPIGVAAEEERSFTNHSVILSEGDMVYLFTDGIVDQFGGPDGKKFKYPNFRKLLLEIFKKSPSEQKAEIMRTFLAWKGDCKQLDDISLFGFRFKS